MRRVRAVLSSLVAVGILLVSGCDWMGYTAHVGTWTYSYVTVDDMGDPLLVEETLTFDASSGFTFVELSTFQDLSQIYTQTRGSVQVIGERLFFDAQEVGLDPGTMALLELLLGVAGLPWSYSGAEWMDIPGFVSEVSALAESPEDALFAEDDFDIGEGTFQISGTTMTLNVGLVVGDFERVP